MMMSVAENARILERELDWVQAVIETAFRRHFDTDCDASIDSLPPPVFDRAGEQRRDGLLMYAEAVQEYGLTTQERLILMLALAPHLRPQLLDLFQMRNENSGRRFTEFGCTERDAHPGLWPTVETAAFILAGDDLERRLGLMALLGPDGALLRHRLVELAAGTNQAFFSSVIGIGNEQLSMLARGTRPNPGAGFPARQLTTELDWDDLVLDETVRQDVEEIRAWIVHGDTLRREWQLGRRVKPVFRSLFYGPPGTGKTLAAALLGKSTGRDVYRVDMSAVMSPYIGATAKHLATLLDEAGRQRWILFFDEADALFSERTEVTDSNKRYASLEVSYLLQRIEDFPGVVIFAASDRRPISEACSRRFQSMVYFPVPGAAQRLLLWRAAFAQPGRLASDVNLEQIAHEHQLSGGAIINVVRYACLMSLRRGTDQVNNDDIRHGIQRELGKEKTQE